jgi:hypothetical protein
MKLLELFITETTEEDRAIISLSSTIYRHMQKYADYIDPKNTEPLDIGKIDDFCTTPLDGIEDISIFLMQGDAFRAKVKADNKEKDDDEDSDGKVTLGAWYSDIPGIYLNADYITSNAIKSTITHELRHALDDLKSEGRANSSGRYTTPKKKEHRINDPYMGNLEYRARPNEINARFSQVLHDITTTIEKISIKNIPPDQLRARAEATLKRSMQTHKISSLFPEKENSRDYKRLMKRAADFILKEIDHIIKTSY